MKKLYIIVIILFSFGLGFIFGKKDLPFSDNKIISYSNVSTGFITQSGAGIEKNKLPPQMIVGPMQSTDCEKFSDTEKDNCLLAVAIRSVKNSTDTEICNTLKNPERCKKAISDQFSRKFDIPITGKYLIQK